MNCLFCQHQLKLIGGYPKHWQCSFCPDTHFFSIENKDEIKFVNINFSYRGVKYQYVEAYDPVWQQEHGFVAFFQLRRRFKTDIIVKFKTPPKINPLNVLKKFLTYKNFS